MEAGGITGAAGHFTLAGSHTYALTGNSTVTLRAARQGGKSVATTEIKTAGAPAR